ncbi:type II toxin-antitoxin system RelE family toxin [Microbacterium paulum]
MSGPYTVVFTQSARRALEITLPESVATAAFEFIVGPLADNPWRLGRPLREPLAPLYSARRGEYRVLYRIEDDRLVIEIVTIEHRRDVYHRRCPPPVEIAQPRDRPSADLSVLPTRCVE